MSMLRPECLPKTDTYLAALPPHRILKPDMVHSTNEPELLVTFWNSFEMLSCGSQLSGIVHATILFQSLLHKNL